MSKYEKSNWIYIIDVNCEQTKQNILMTINNLQD